MNVLQDPTKKTSINSLLNPQDGSFSGQFGLSPAGLDANTGQSHNYPGNFHGPYHSNGTYSLGPASWEDSKRKALNGGQPHRQYTQYTHHPQMGPSPQSDSYPEHESRATMRPRMEHHEYGHGGQHWTQSSHAGPNMQYDGPSGMQYSHERTAIPESYSSQSAYPSHYEDHPIQSNGQQSWQASERVSVRLAAKDTVPESSSTQDAAYTTHSYYPPQDIVYTPAPEMPYSQQHVSVALPPATQTHPDSTPTNRESSSKRRLSESEATPAPKSKRARPKAKSTSSGTTSGGTPSAGTSKRGYNAKKRLEAATIAAQNATAARRIQEDDDFHQSAPSEGVPIKLVPELQFARCMSNRYKSEGFPRCVACTRRWAGDTCRFQGIRFFMRDQQGKLLGISFAEHNGPFQESNIDFPERWNRKFEREHIRRSKLSIAKALLPTLKAELSHIAVQELVRRPRESEVRVTCDTCMTSLFSTTFLCRLCGREVCSECFQQVRDLTEEPTNATEAELAAFTGRREKHAHANPFFLSCLKRNDHSARDFTPVTRFAASELRKAVTEMERIMGEEKREQTAEESRNFGSSNSRLPPPNGRTIAYSQLNVDAPFPDPMTLPVFDDFTPSNLLDHITSIPIYRAQIIPASYYDTPSPSSHSIRPSPSFAALWKNGLPLLVKDISPRFKLRWDPHGFIEKFGPQSCVIVECQTDVNKKVSVGQFFSLFGKYEGREDCWKLKDWPPTAEFKTAFPELFEDFSGAVPVPDYVRRDGVYNIGSHFPTNAVGPDLGPKMYNSMASSQEAGSKGSTRLHMDMADALNVMLYASNCPDGTPGYAAWDLYRAEDSDKLRAFLKKRFGVTAAASTSGQAAADKAAAAVQIQMAAHDPIHSQQFYLDVELRKALFDEYGVKSFRIYQRPGEGVFIPAGCAHQVANMADSMKIAIDFVSPENIDRCEKLTKEFREQNQRKVWKEDVLQLRTMMWFAWKSCYIKERELDEDESSLGGDTNTTMNTMASGSGLGNGVRMIDSGHSV